ncbi:hypothetical protein PSD17_14460 [Pseudonocardia sp. D17]|nr:hypothetical protein PSD17_14460 [Pseudonocardia sp. D17]
MAAQDGEPCRRDVHACEIIIARGGPDLAVAFAALAIDPQDSADAGDRDLLTSQPGSPDHRGRRCPARCPGQGQ